MRRGLNCVVVVLVAAAVLLTLRAFTGPSGDGPRPALSPRDRLLLLADLAGPAAGDASRGRYSRIHIRRWVRTGERYAQWDSRRWRAPDGSGRLAERRYDPVPALSETARDAAGGPVVRTDYPAGSLRLRVGEPFPASAAGLLAAFGDEAPTGILTGLLDLIAIRYLGPAERAAVLRVLAALPGLAFLGAGPHGLGFSFEGPGPRLQLLVDVSTGEVTGWQYGEAERILVLDRTRVARLPDSA